MSIEQNLFDTFIKINLIDRDDKEIGVINMFETDWLNNYGFGTKLKFAGNLYLVYDSEPSEDGEKITARVELLG